jgi:hypothetical protein
MREWNSRMKRILGVALIAAAVSMFAAVPLVQAMAGHAAGSSDPSTTCPVNDYKIGVSTPAGAHRVVSVTWTTYNDEDSGLHGYWAMDTYKQTLNIWYLTEGPSAGGYFFTMTFSSGSFIVPVGAVSPSAGTSEPASGYGTLSGLLYGNITSAEALSNPGHLALSGTLAGSPYNYGGSMSDVLTAEVSQVGDTGIAYGSTTYAEVPTGTASWWFYDYFTPANPSDFSNTYGFNYVLNNAFHGTTSTNDWCDYTAGTPGDIITAV